MFVFAYIFLFLSSWFLILSSCLIATKIWNDRPKRLNNREVITQYRSFMKTDTPNIWKQAKPEGIIFLIHLGYLPLYFLTPSFFVVLCAK